MPPQSAEYGLQGSGAPKQEDRAAAASIGNSWLFCLQACSKWAPYIPWLWRLTPGFRIAEVSNTPSASTSCMTPEESGEPEPQGGFPLSAQDVLGQGGLAAFALPTYPLVLVWLPLPFRSSPISTRSARM